ncbi:MASE1 domain-containing protein [Mesorhizobium japonicum]|uniref:histidine kinase n=1 Tax=Mesorhizobium japonicum (strain LMG 29417 / CECT 9101 / MAFF 303099) TaxID=266835 RepID=Q98LK8_RHILO|nr:MASE1 domain-containing protein [Mesorhizobium japonicum]BAB48455.1 two component sensor-kinase [Mesorhizobium japonicum MAFF 303099]
MTTASNSLGETNSEAAPALKDDLDRSEPGSQGDTRPLVAVELARSREYSTADLEANRRSYLWSSRPRILHLGLFVTAYVLAAGFAQALAVVPGTGISIWPPSGLFIATLVIAPTRSWPWWVIAGLLGELFSSALWFHNSLPVALLIYSGNALEAITGAWLVNLACRRPVRLETLQEVLAFVLLAAGLAPFASATVGSATLAWFGVQSFATAWPLWWIGDATGVLIVAPLAVVVFQNLRGKTRLSGGQWMEAGVLGLIFLSVSTLSLSGYLPFAYIVMPPLLWAAVRFEFKGAAVTLTLLALITAIFTISGASQFISDPQSQKHSQIMLQLFLAISAFSALIVAAISRQHQQAVLTLRESQRQLQQMIDALPVRVWSATPAGEPLYFNKRYQDHFRSVIRNFESLRTPSIDGLVHGLAHPEDAPEVQRTLRACFESGSAAVMRFRLLEKDGAYRWSECRVEPRRDDDGAVAEWYGVSVDIDDEVRAQQALRERERELSQLVDMVPVQIRRLTPEGNPTFFNKRLLDFFGLNDLAQLDKPGMSRLAAAITSLVHPEDTARLLETVRHSLATGEPYSTKYRMRRADGAYRWVDGRGEPVRDQSGAIVQWFAISIDVDDEMRLYSDLAEREAKIRRLVDSDIIGIVIWDLDGRLIDANDAFLRMVQCDRADLQAGLRWFDMTPPEWQEVHAREEAEELKATGKMQAREKEFFRKDGSRIPVLIGAACFEGQSKQGVAYILDLTERKRAEAAQVRAEEALRRASEELARAMNAASLAELSASIAHEVNQPLAAVVANSNACERWLMAEPPNVQRAQKIVGRIIRDANSAADVVSRIRALFKQSLDARLDTTLGGVVDQARTLMAEEAARSRVPINIDVERDLPVIALDRVQIQQVLVNLMRNGIEAMDGVGDPKSLAVRVHRVGDAIQTEVSDWGPGVEQLDRMFEPFFTTKEQGMGMGLAISRSIVESHGGRLWVEKNEPRGATFIFTLPVETEKAP